MRRRILVPALLFAFAGLALATPEDPAIPADTEIQTTGSGLKYSVLQAGTGTVHPKIGDVVKVHYTGWLTDGKMFDSSRARGEPTSFTLGEVVEGWNEGLQLMTKGARWKLTIPAILGYGASGRPGIPPNATLIFDVELLDVVPAPKMPEFRPGNPAAQQKTESGIVYEVIQPGQGDPPGADDGFELKFALWTTGGKLLDATEKSGQTLVGRPQDFSIKFIGEAVRLLRPGARLRFEVPPELGFGSRSPGPDLPPNSQTVWELELVRVNRPMPIPDFAMSAPDKVVTTPSGLQIETLVEGTGASPKIGDTVEVHYAGWLTDGTLFDSSYPRGAPAKFKLGRVIAGWNEGLAKMKVGGKARLTIPGTLGYGAKGTPDGKIGPNATLVFLVELLGVTP